MRRFVVGTIGFLLAMASYAELKLPAVFSDGMVLQREQKVPVWGWANPGEEVSISFAGQEQTVKADKDGKFMVRLKKLDASKEPRSLKVASGTESREVKDVLVGEVWLCSGQSNMQMPVSGAMDFDKEKDAADHPLLRMFLTDQNTSLAALPDCTGAWKVCTPDNVGQFSATAYFFGRELQKELDVPVGLIRSCWGGTRIESWSPMASLEQFPSVMEYKAQEDGRAESFDQAAVDERFAKQFETWKQNVKQAKANGKKEPKRPKKPTNPHASHNYPANLYNAMINPLVPYGMRGAIWYQGEANSKTLGSAILYRDLLENLVVQWRKDWDQKFPFYAVQLPNFKAPQVKPVEDSTWAFIRESFLDFSKEVPNTGIAITIDIGEEKNIHPKNKQAAGYRLAQQALAKTYGKNVVPGGPIYKSMKRDGNKIIIKFTDIGSGLVEQGGTPLKTFAVAGADKKFVFAQAAIVDNTVIVSSTEVPEPVAVRYAWADNPVGCNLYNKEGFPASPFRTDDWPPAGE
ncbi:MAG: sialate O-acetylesterase [Kiritimatiellales bacterium]|nr:sialate O-acetylesterase [Kiritimatiellales bacterium]MCF7863183.1 sialate O-acetylesterase [Kiritimatiellales bacterium]